MNETLTVVFLTGALLAGGITVFSLFAMVRNEALRSAQSDLFLASLPVNGTERSRR
jgi:hypothetical protein